MSLATDLLAAFGNALTQNQRLLKLHTPLGADVLVAERIEIEEMVGPSADGDISTGDAGGPAAGTRLVVHALAGDAHLELKRLLGRPVLVELLTQQSHTDLRPWHGHVTSMSLLGSDGGLARFRLVVEPWLAFLGRRQDSWVFQDRTVVQIVEEVFADYAGRGSLAPLWRWELADASVYPQRSLCIQYQESDLQFVQRLLREEGLFFWHEHTGDTDAASLGTHTLVIADHNGAFKANAQARVRYTQSHMALGEDSITRWQHGVHVRTAALALASPDHRSLSLRPVEQSGGNAPIASLTLSDIPGAYAYEDVAQGERLALRQMQAIDALREQFKAEGSVRTAAPATTFTLLDHPVHDGSDAERDEFVVLRAVHHARNNVAADAKAQVESLVGAIRRAKTDGAGRGLANASEEPLYRCDLVAQRAAVPVRVAAIDESGEPDPRLHPRPSLRGVQTAIVVGAGAPIHTDRDHRIKVQFHWQRGANASHRLDHSAGSNAPASEASGTWVRVAETVAGANWGMNFTPRLGQEVLVAFVEGDIDRPLVVGSVYNGQGSANAQGNGVGAGAATSTGNAAAWFPGDQPQGALQAHQHSAVHAGFKSQELAASQGGGGGYNQLVFDDTPESSRIELSSSSAATRLQLGHLLQQTDNQRLQPRGHGLDLASAAWGAVRAGSGLLVSGHGKPSSLAGGQHLDSREPIAQLAEAQQLVHTLAESAQKQNAKLPGERDVVGATADDTSRQLDVERAFQATGKSLATIDQQGSGGEGGAGAGGGGSVAAWSRPDVVVAAPGGIAAFTPASSVYAAGNTFGVVAGQDLQHLAQANHSTAVKSGIVLYTYGKATSASKPNTETGLKLHAATGSVNTQSQSAATHLVADKAIDVTSTTAMVRITAPQHVLLTAGGAALDIEAGNITLKGPGKIEFKAAMKELSGAGSAQATVELKKPPQIKGCAKAMEAAAATGAAV